MEKRLPMTPGLLAMVAEFDGPHSHPEELVYTMTGRATVEWQTPQGWIEDLIGAGVEHDILEIRALDFTYSLRSPEPAATFMRQRILEAMTRYIHDCLAAGEHEISGYGRFPVTACRVITKENYEDRTTRHAQDLCDQETRRQSYDGSAREAEDTQRNQAAEEAEYIDWRSYGGSILVDDEIARQMIAAGVPASAEVKAKLGLSVGGVTMPDTYHGIPIILDTPGSQTFQWDEVRQRYFQVNEQRAMEDPMIDDDTLEQIWQVIQAATPIPLIRSIMVHVAHVEWCIAGVWTPDSICVADLNQGKDALRAFLVQTFAEGFAHAPGSVTAVRLVRPLAEATDTRTVAESVEHGLSCLEHHLCEDLGLPLGSIAAARPAADEEDTMLDDETLEQIWQAITWTRQPPGRPYQSRVVEYMEIGTVSVEWQTAAGIWIPDMLGLTRSYAVSADPSAGRVDLRDYIREVLSQGHPYHYGMHMQAIRLPPLTPESDPPPPDTRTPAERAYDATWGRDR